MRISSVTSRPSSSVRSPGSILSDAAIEPAGTPRSVAASATARYIAPVSRYVKPSASATARATVDLPAPAGPSIATTVTDHPGDDAHAISPATSSANPGYDTSAASIPITSTPSSDASPATAPSSASRWSP